MQRAEHAESRSRRARQSAEEEVPEEELPVAVADARRSHRQTPRDASDGRQEHICDGRDGDASERPARKRRWSNGAADTAPHVLSLDKQRMLDDIEAERRLQKRLAKKLKHHKARSLLIETCRCDDPTSHCAFSPPCAGPG